MTTHKHFYVNPLFPREYIPVRVITIAEYERDYGGEVGTPSLDVCVTATATAAPNPRNCQRLDKALAWSQDFSRELRPRQVHSNNVLVQASVERIDEHFRQKRVKGQLREQRRRANMAAVPHTLTAAEWDDIVTAHGHRCAYCGTFRKRLTIDHVVPISKGGAHSKENVVPACGRCNSAKGAKMPTDVQPVYENGKLIGVRWFDSPKDVESESPKGGTVNKDE